MWTHGRLIQDTLSTWGMLALMGWWIFAFGLVVAALVARLRPYNWRQAAVVAGINLVPFLCLALLLAQIPLDRLPDMAVSKDGIGHTLSLLVGLLPSILGPMAAIWLAFFRSPSRPDEAAPPWVKLP